MGLVFGGVAALLAALLSHYWVTSSGGVKEWWHGCSEEA